MKGRSLLEWNVEDSERQCSGGSKVPVEVKGVHHRDRQNVEWTSPRKFNMFFTRYPAFVSSKPGLLTHTKLNCRVPLRRHIAD